MHVLAPCLPGFGDSANMQPPQSIEEFARIVLGFLTAKGIVRFFLLGHSMGGMIVQEMAKQAPDKIAALILYGTGPIGVIPAVLKRWQHRRMASAKRGNYRQYAFADKMAG